ncbi:MAG TPA: HD-GYP domain-containing protein [Candidatus Acidoferrum sp.]|jgi:HD-GYP domain-containing protein (c-di-GMP phosphodiesterase class II)|nr:HD-GYP domain-containing protein [Candidatus Acidoferrum sp.]
MTTLCELPPAIELESGSRTELKPESKTRHESSALRREQLRNAQLENQIRDLHSNFVCCLNQLLDLRDLNTGLHSTRLAEWGLLVARSLGVSERDMYELEMGALLHDIGKVGVPDNILNKPGRLTDEEYEVVKRHPEFGWTVIRKLKGLEQSSLYVLHHHENFDGTGYPAKLKGHETPIGARIVSVIDAFDAMVSARPYRKGMPIPEALRRLHDVAGKQFDPAVVNSFTEFAQKEMASVIEAVGASENIVF